MAHRLNAWARIGDGEHSYKLYKMLLRKGTTLTFGISIRPFKSTANSAVRQVFAKCCCKVTKDFCAPSPLCRARGKTALSADFAPAADLRWIWRGKTASYNFFASRRKRTAFAKFCSQRGEIRKFFAKNSLCRSGLMQTE